MSTLYDYTELRKFVSPEFVFGAGARLLAGRYSKNFVASKVLVVTDAGVTEAGWASQVVSSLEEEKLDCTVFSSVTPNPRADEVMQGARIYEKQNCNVIVAVGGGSVIDCAKGIGIVSSNGKHILDFEGIDKVPVPGPPLICIPTTAGSSADVSQFAIINDHENRNKIAIISKSVVPDVALIDPVTTTTMDAHLTTCTGMDALTHGIEAYVSNASSPFTDIHALEAIRLITGTLPHLLSDMDNLRLRSTMMMGSLHAGLAFSNASLGALHAMSHSMGGLLDMPHGHCNAILLPRVMEFNFDEVPERYISIGEAMGLSLHGKALLEQKKEILGEVERLQHTVGVCPELGEVGISRSDIPKLAEHAMHDICIVTNPRKPSLKDIEGIYEKAF